MSGISAHLAAVEILAEDGFHLPEPISAAARAIAILQSL
jgi:hypothetical protein